MSAQIIEADIFKADEQYIAHQCNCLTNDSAGFAREIFNRFPHSNVYADRIRDQPGTIKICGGSLQNSEERGVIALFAQVYPGRTRYPLSKQDGLDARKNYFKRCLDAMATAGVVSVALPWGIGCNMAGGNWEFYKDMIDGFASEHPKIKVCIYKKPALEESE